MSRRVVVPVVATEAMTGRGGDLLSEWFNDNAPIGQKFYEPQATRLFAELLTAAPPYEPSEAEVRAACEQIDALLEKIMTAKHGFVYATMDTARAALIAADKARREGGR